ITVENETPTNECEEITVENETPTNEPEEITVENETPTNEPEEITVENETPTNESEEITVENETPTNEPEEISVEKELPTNEPEEISVEKELPTNEPEEVTVEKEIPSNDPKENTVEKEMPTKETEAITVEKELPRNEPEEITVEKELPRNEPEEISVEKEMPTKETEAITVEKELPRNEPEEISVEKEIPTKETEEITVEKELPRNEPEEISVEKEIPTKETEAITVEKELPRNEPEEISVEKELPTKETEEISVEKEIPTKETEDISVEKELPRNEPEEISVEKEIPTKETEEISVEKEIPTKETEEISVEIEIPPKKSVKKLRNLEETKVSEAEEISISELKEKTLTEEIPESKTLSSTRINKNTASHSSELDLENVSSKTNLKLMNCIYDSDTSDESDLSLPSMSDQKYFLDCSLDSDNGDDLIITVETTVVPSNDPKEITVEKEIPTNESEEITVENETPTNESEGITVENETPTNESEGITVENETPTNESEEITVENEPPTKETEEISVEKEIPPKQTVKKVRNLEETQLSEVILNLETKETQALETTKLLSLESKETELFETKDLDPLISTPSQSFATKDLPSSELTEPSTYFHESDFNDQSNNCPITILHKSYFLDCSVDSDDQDCLQNSCVINSDKVQGSDSSNLEFVLQRELQNLELKISEAIITSTLEITQVQSSETEDVYVSASKDVQTSEDTDVKTFVDTDVQTSVDTDFKTFVETDVQTSVDTDFKTFVETDVQTSVDTDVQTFVETDVQTSVDTDFKTFVETDVQTSVDIDVQTSEDKNVQTFVDKDVQTSVDKDVQTSVDKDVQTSVDKDVQTSVDKDVQTSEDIDVQTSYLTTEFATNANQVSVRYPSSSETATLISNSITSPDIFLPQSKDSFTNVVSSVSSPISTSNTDHLSLQDNRLIDIFLPQSKDSFTNVVSSVSSPISTSNTDHLSLQDNRLIHDAVENVNSTDSKEILQGNSILECNHYLEHGVSLSEATCEDSNNKRTTESYSKTKDSMIQLNSAEVSENEQDTNAVDFYDTNSEDELSTVMPVLPQKSYFLDCGIDSDNDETVNIILGNEKCKVVDESSALSRFREFFLKDSQKISTVKKDAILENKESKINEGSSVHYYAKQEPLAVIAKNLNVISLDNEMSMFKSHEVNGLQINSNPEHEVIVSEPNDVFAFNHNKGAFVESKCTDVQNTDDSIFHQSPEIRVCTNDIVLPETEVSIISETLLSEMNDLSCNLSSNISSLATQGSATQIVVQKSGIKSHTALTDLNVRGSDAEVMPNNILQKDKETVSVLTNSDNNELNEMPINYLSPNHDLKASATEMKAEENMQLCTLFYQSDSEDEETQDDRFVNFVSKPYFVNCAIDSDDELDVENCRKNISLCAWTLTDNESLDIVSNHGQGIISMSEDVDTSLEEIQYLECIDFNRKTNIRTNLRTQNKNSEKTETIEGTYTSDPHRTPDNEAGDDTHKASDNEADDDSSSSAVESRCSSSSVEKDLFNSATCFAPHESEESAEASQNQTNTPSQASLVPFNPGACSPAAAQRHDVEDLAYDDDDTADPWAGKGFCLLCRKQSDNLMYCTFCYTVKYCSEKCRRKDETNHAETCERFERFQEMKNTAESMTNHSNNQLVCHFHKMPHKDKSQSAVSVLAEIIQIHSNSRHYLLTLQDASGKTTVLKISKNAEKHINRFNGLGLPIELSDYLKEGNFVLLNSPFWHRRSGHLELVDQRDIQIISSPENQFDVESFMDDMF
ncbi:fibronectin-binding protein A, partial [Biomphalaria glabrata]